MLELWPPVPWEKNTKTTTILFFFCGVDDGWYVVYYPGTVGVVGRLGHVF